MKRIFLSTCAVASVLAMAPAANAAVFEPGDPQFQVTFDPDGTISANIGDKGLSGPFSDSFNFNLLVNGLGSGGVIASFSSAASLITLTQVLVNGTPLTVKTDPDTGFTSASAFGIILNSVPNSIVINGTAATNSSYGGNITFTPTIASVPEPAAWGMMVLGFGVIGAALRNGRRRANVTFA